MLNLSQKFGFDARRQQARLDMLGLKGDYKAQCYRLQREVIRPAREDLVREFLVWLRRHDELIQYLNAVEPDQLRTGLRQYVETFGVINMDSYFESRLKVGLTHWMLDVPVSLYTCGHRFMQQLIVDRILMTCAPGDAREMIALTLKIMALDLTLVTDTYRLAQVSNLVRKLKNQMDETYKFRLKATLDSLTGLANREHAMTLGEESIKAAREGGLAACVIMMDIDFFKKVNDTYGHPTGDAVLKAVASTMKTALRGHDVVGRYGGEEFIIFLRGPRSDEFWSVAERLRLTVASRPIHGEGNVVPVTISQGMAVAGPNDTLADLIKRADEALYKAKNSGRNRVMIG